MRQPLFCARRISNSSNTKKLAMKKLSVPIIFMSLILLTGCFKDKCQQFFTYTKYNPVYMSYDELRSSVASESPRELKNPGKIYLKDQYVFVSEMNEGIHVIDNSNPETPENIAFIRVPGNIDISVRGNIMYVDSYIDLVAINIDNPHNVVETHRVEEAFDHRFLGTGLVFDPVEGVVIDWIAEEVTEELDCNGGWFGGPIMFEDALTASGNGSTSGGGTIVPSVGVAGSMARFALVDQYLYIIDGRDLQLYSVGDIAKPSFFNSVNIGFGIETIFPYGDKLFIGSQTGMFIFDNSSPSSPFQIGSFAHVRSCE